MSSTCGLCDDYFSDLNTFKKHCSYHSYDLPFFCRKCKYICCDSDLLERHYSIKHKDFKTSLQTSEHLPGEENKLSQVSYTTIRITSESNETIEPILTDMEIEASSHHDIETNNAKDCSSFCATLEHLKCTSSDKLKEKNNRKHSLNNLATDDPTKCSSSKLNKKPLLYFKERVTFDVGNVCLDNTSDLITPGQRHAVNQSYVCTCCSFIASTSKELKAHKKIHMLGVVYECHICDFFSNHKGTLTRHLRVHSENRPFKCELCDYSTRHQSTLDTHKKVHYDSLSYFFQYRVIGGYLYGVLVFPELDVVMFALCRLEMVSLCQVVKVVLCRLDMVALCQMVKNVLCRLETVALCQCLRASGSDWDQETPNIKATKYPAADNPTTFLYWLLLIFASLISTISSQFFSLVNYIVHAEFP
ncbi:hypothetical protein Btru_012271 [Bulinus truncatus]|nr:hypothetical protein Btru_012271 [Bulinus truncatus]